VSPKTISGSNPLAPDNTGTQDDILYVIVEPGTGANLTTPGNVDIELPTEVTLFDNDGSEILQSVTIEGLPDDYALEFGAFDPFAGSGISTEPGA
jgi:hypothetical protein